jgi:hypothetical protein
LGDVNDRVGRAFLPDQDRQECLSYFVDVQNSGTICTKYPGQGDFTNLVIAGDCAVEDGIWAHPANSGGDTPVDRLKVTVSGDFTLASNAVVNLQGRGFAAGFGPGAGNGLVRSAGGGSAASHGGRGGVGTNATPANTYDAVAAPTNLGSGAFGPAAGNLELLVGGTARIDGSVQASAGLANVANPGAAGGTVFITAGALAGSGAINASGGSGYQSGGGGRIAVILTNGMSFANVAMLCSGGTTSAAAKGAAGTVYCELPGGGTGQGELVIDNAGLSTPTTVYTPLDSNQPDISNIALTLTNRGSVGLLSDLTIRDLRIRTNTATRLYLNGYRLTIRTPFHPDWGHTNWVSYDGGQIIWLMPGSILQVY